MERDARQRIEGDSKRRGWLIKSFEDVEAFVYFIKALEHMDIPYDATAESLEEPDYSVGKRYRVHYPDIEKRETERLAAKKRQDERSKE